MAKNKTTHKKGFKAPVNTKTGKEGTEAVSTKADAKGRDGPADNPRAVTGDNVLSEDQIRLVFFNHLKLRKEADADVAAAEIELRAAKAAKKTVNKMIQGEGSSLVDIETALRLEEGEGKAMQAEIENRIKIARWLNIPFGFQFELIDQDRRPAVDRAFEEGKIAGLKGAPRKPPHDPSTKQYTRWIEGHHEGQAVLSKKFKPLEKTDVPQGSKPKTEAAGEKPKTEAAGDKAGGPAPSAAGVVSAASGGGGTAGPGPMPGTTSAAPKTPPAPPADDNVVDLQTGGKKVAIA